MKIVVIGGTGLIGSNLIKKLSQLGHTAIAAAPATGVNTITKEGLSDVLKGADVVVDVANSPSFEDNAVLEFFRTSTTNLLSAEAAAGVKHHVAMSIVGADRLPDSGYLRAKVAMEGIVKKGGVPYTILRSTQFFEFAASIAQAGTVGDQVHISTGLFQPIASSEVVTALADIVVGKPQNTTVEVGGPNPVRMSDFIAYYLTATNDPRKLMPDPHARYFGTELTTDALVPGKNARLGKINFPDWLKTQLLKA